jgi:hypothetical protein
VTTAKPRPSGVCESCGNSRPLFTIDHRGIRHLCASCERAMARQVAIARRIEADRARATAATATETATAVAAKIRPQNRRRTAGDETLC